MRKYFKTITTFILLLGMYLSSSPVMAGKHPNSQFMVALEYEVVEVLKKHGMQVAHDRELPWLYTDSIPGNYVLTLYKADEIPQQAVLDIIRMCFNYYDQRGRKEKFQILMYRESHDEWRHSLFLGIGILARVKPYFELIIGENKQ